jgi:hypothetical protein
MGSKRYCISTFAVVKSGHVKGAYAVRVTVYNPESEYVNSGSGSVEKSPPKGYPKSQR